MSRNIVRKSLLVISLSALLAIVVISFFKKKEVDLSEKYADTELSEVIGFNVKGLPESAAGGLRSYYDKAGNCYFDVYLPWDKETDLQVVCDKEVEVTINDSLYHSGDTFLPSAMEYVYADFCVPDVKNQSGMIRFISTYGLPSVHMVTESETKDYLTDAKGNTAEGYCTVLDEDGEKDYFGICDIRVHGNTSWFNDKKSYQFNLDYSSQILGMSAQRKWVLISEYEDESFMCDAITYELSRKTGDRYTPDSRFVNVYLNGQYEGLYLLLQKISIEGGTINDLNDLETFNNKSQGKETVYNITGGYLVELSGELGVQEVDESLRLETPHRWLRVRSPNNITQLQHEYLSALVNEADEALYLPDGEVNDLGKTWEDYFDKETWIRQYLLHEISANHDTDLCSLYFYVKEDERVLYGGPGWDFDKSFRHYIGNERLNYKIRSLYNNSVFDNAKNENGFLWLRQLDTHEGFHSDMKKYYLEVAEPYMRQILSEDVPGWQVMIDESVKADCTRWDRSYDVYREYQDNILDAFAKRLDFLHDYYENESDYSILTFTLTDLRRNLVVPVKNGHTIEESSLPIFNDCADWFYRDEQFTVDTVVNEDMTLILIPQPENEEE